MKEGINVEICSETFLGCMISSIIFIIMLIGAFWVNYKFINGNDILDVFIIFLVFSVGFSLKKGRTYEGVSKEKFEKIKVILEQ